MKGQREQVSIRWDELEPQGYEDMVSVLLSRLHPEAQRIDGKGGDGGRDVQIVNEQDGSISDAFELKSFTGRMTSSRRRQVISSLDRVVALNPACWTLVVPIDPTPGEIEWFRQLGTDYCFPTRWYGKTWLDERMSAFPDIRRYFLERTEHELNRLLQELVEERAMVADAHDAVGRVRRLREHLDKIDPHYRYELATGPTAANIRPSDVVFSVSFNDVRVDIYPKYLGAPRDRPITITANVVVDPEFGEIQKALDYGLGATIPPHLISSLVVDAPAGLGGSFTTLGIDLLPTDTSLDDPVTLAVEVVDGNRLLASCPIHLTEQTWGLKGGILTGTDSTSWLEASLTADIVAREFTAEFKLVPKPVMPSALMPLCRWLSTLQPTRGLRIRWPNGFEVRSEVQTSFPFDQRLGRVIEAFAYLQDHSGIYWEISPSLIHEDEEEVVMAANLLQGKSIDFTWESLNLRLDHWGPPLEELLDGRPHAYLIEQDMWLKLEEATIPIGRVQTHFESACLADPIAVQRALIAGSPTQIRLVPGDSNKARRHRHMGTAGRRRP